ncbi:MAG: DUF262 domain-containing protein [Candidatus Poribacteria bacterium]|nr:DUF262 domain-containing protein [Candidatus Poribacteria bacterium]
MSTFNSDKRSLQNILEDIETGQIQLPDFQRNWRWDDEHILSLIASISQSFPVGAIMMLKNGGSVRFEKRRIAGTKPEIDGVTPDILILDGQQRLTALFQSLISGHAVNTLDPKKKKVQRWYYLDMKQCVADIIDWEGAVISVPKNRIVKGFRGEVILDLSDSNKEYQQNLFPVSRIFDTDPWMQGYLEYWELAQDKWALYQKFNNEVIKSFEQYQVPTITLDKDTPKEAVCLIFEKVNQQGVQLNVFELLTASLAAESFRLRDDWKLRQKRLREYKVLGKLEDVNFLQALTLIVTKNQNPAISCKRKDILELDRRSYEDWADQVENGFMKAARFLHRQKIFDAKDVPYSAQLVPLAAILTDLGNIGETEGTHRKIARWYWCGVLGEMYGAATDTRFASDLSEVTEWVKETGKEPRTIREANFREDRLSELRTRNGAAYKGIHALIMHDRDTTKCSDFRTGVPIDEKIFFDDKIDIHHIFPKKWCDKQGVESNDYNSIINKTALSARTNRMIGGRAPSEYLRRIQKGAAIETSKMDEILNSHLICPRTLRADNFKDFFQTRKEALLEVIEKAMGKKAIREGDDLPDTSV